MPQNKNQPPISPEQWLDIVIAAPAHRSQNDAHREFGQMLIQRYYSTVPDRYHEDTNASAYFDEMLCSVASAIRAMSVVRDEFETNWQAIKTVRDQEIQNAEIWSMFSPFRKDGYWGKAVSVLIAIGIGGALSTLLKTFVYSATLPWLVALGLAVPAALFGTEIFVQRQRARCLRDCAVRFPKDILDCWEARSLSGYRKVASWFLPLAFEISDRYYPTNCRIPDGCELESMVDRHFVF